MAAARSADPVLAKIRLMWLLTVCGLRNSSAALQRGQQARRQLARVGVGGRADPVLAAVISGYGQPCALERSPGHVDSCAK
jgi:hypothetical protein